MNELAYLGTALLVSIIGSLVFLRTQRRPHSLESGVQQFSRGISALAKARQSGGSNTPGSNTAESGTATRK